MPKVDPVSEPPSLALQATSLGTCDLITYKQLLVKVFIPQKLSSQDELVTVPEVL